MREVREVMGISLAVLLTGVISYPIYSFFKSMHEELAKSKAKCNQLKQETDSLIKENQLRKKEFELRKKEFELHKKELELLQKKYLENQERTNKVSSAISTEYTIDFCPSMNNDWSKVDFLTFDSQSGRSQQELNILMNLYYNTSSIIDEVIYTTATSRIVQVNKAPLINIYDYKSYERLCGNESIGIYFSSLDAVLVSNSTQVRELSSSIIHELTHKAMLNVFNNQHAPYNKDDIVAQAHFSEATKKVLLRISENFNIPIENDMNAIEIAHMMLENILGYVKYKDRYTNSTTLVFSNYYIDDGEWLEEEILQVEFLGLFMSVFNENIYAQTQSTIDAEVIARVPETLSVKFPVVTDLIQPLVEYWEEHITPAVNRYLNDHNASSIFPESSICFKWGVDDFYGQVAFFDNYGQF